MPGCLDAPAGGHDVRAARKKFGRQVVRHGELAGLERAGAVDCQPAIRALAEQHRQLHSRRFDLLRRLGLLLLCRGKRGLGLPLLRQRIDAGFDALAREVEQLPGTVEIGGRNAVCREGKGELVVGLGDTGR